MVFAVGVFAVRERVEEVLRVNVERARHERSIDIFPMGTLLVSAIYLRPVLATPPPTHQSKPIGHAPCSGLVQYIFSSPARLPSRFLPAYAYCRRAAKLKMLFMVVKARLR